MRQAFWMAAALAGWAWGQVPAAPSAADRLARVDAQGVLRWQDDGAEVALFGVNYYTPFWHNYPDLKSVGADHRQVIDGDVAHFARMGLDALRLHVFDREVSDREGKLLANEHLELLDYLIARAKERGIYTVLTPIAWWGVPGDSPGFSTGFTMQQMTTDAGARRPQTNYLAQFVRHRNRFTGLTYGEDPAVVAFELINEPIYPEGTSDAQITDYINALADALRATGCRKPVFYNGWLGRLRCVAAARVDGSTFGWYPSGLAAGRSLTRNFLPAVNEYGGNNPWNPSMRLEALARKAKIVYEFDAADIPGSYVYPAMARAFRSGGAQIATQFQYDPLPLAPFNQGWQTHFLNLVCAPQKAVSFLIAAEAFRRLARLQDYGAYPRSCRFGPFRVSYEEDLSEMVTEREFFHSNSTRTEPPAPEKLERVIGCGSSPLVGYEGTGAWFLERLSPGAWRLEVQPDAVWVNDPYGAHRLDREVARILWREWPLCLRLSDLGNAFSVEPLDAGNTHRSAATNGSCLIRPGVFLLRRAGDTGEAWQNAQLAARVGLREFVAWPASRGPAVARHDPPPTWVEGRPLPLAFTVPTAPEPEEATLLFGRLNAGGEAPQRIRLQRERAYRYSAVLPGAVLKEGQLAYRLELRTNGSRFTLPAPADGRTSSWEVAVQSSRAPVLLFDAAHHAVRMEGGVPHRQTVKAGSESGRQALRVAVDRFGPPPSALSFRREADGDLDPWREVLAQRGTLCMKARALEPSTTAVEIVLRERDGSCWGANLTLGTDWRSARLPLTSFRFYRHWEGNPPERGGPGDHVRPAEIGAVTVCFGAWLYPGHTAEPHTLEIESIAIEE